MRYFLQIVGAILSFVGTLAAVISGLLFTLLFFHVGRYGTATIAAVISALPAVLINLGIRALGRAIKKRAEEMETGDDSKFYGPASPASDLLPAKKEPS